MSTQIPKAPRSPSAQAKKLIFAFPAGDQIGLIVGGVLLLVGFPVLLLCASELTDAIRYWTDPIQQKASITKVLEEYTEEGAPRADVLYRYQQNGQAFEGGGTLASSKDKPLKVSVGGEIPIEVSSADPSRSQMPGMDLYSGPIVVGLSLGLPLSLIGLLFVSRAIRARRRRVKAYVYGTPINAKIISVGFDEKVRVGTKHPLFVSWAFEVEGQTYEGFFSSMEEAQIKPLVSSEEISVVYLPQNPKINTLYLP